MSSATRQSFGLPLIIALLAGAGCSQPEPATQSESEVKTTEPAVSATASTMPPLTPVVGNAPSSTSDTFTFWVFGDNQGGPEIFAAIMQEMKNATVKPAFALSLGDLIAGKPVNPDKEAIHAELDTYYQAALAGTVPIFNAPGNHEMDDSNDCPNQTMHDAYKEPSATSGGWPGAPLYGAFNYGNSRFIALNTQDIPPTSVCPDANNCTVPACGHCVSGQPEKKRECSYISDAQLQLLDDDLAANTDKEHIFILMHYPVEPKPSENYPSGLTPATAKKLTDVLAKYDNIRFVLASHQHLYYNPQDPTNDKSIPTRQAGQGQDPYYLVSGGAGAEIFGTGTGDFHHYLIFEVDSGEVSAKIHKVQSG